MRNIETVNVLTLEYRTDRQLSISAEASRQNFNIKWWKGERAIERADVKKAICSGHKRIIRYAKENNLEEIIICEDDCKFFSIGGFDYFVENKPKSYDLYCGLIYQGELQGQRIVNGMSGTMTLYYCHSRFYDVFLNDIADDSHVDRSLGNLSHKYEYYVPPMYVCEQSGSYSDHMRKSIDYTPYLKDKILFPGAAH